MTKSKITCMVTIESGAKQSPVGTKLIDVTVSLGPDCTVAEETCEDMEGHGFDVAFRKACALFTAQAQAKDQGER